MGMAASQARYLALVARKSNCEYEGQQINQARTVLSNQTANLFNQMLGLSVPVPPSTQDFTKTQYSFLDGGNKVTMDSWNQLAKSDENYNYSVTYHYYSDVYTGTQKKMTNPQVQLSGAIPSVDYNTQIESIQKALVDITKCQKDYDEKLAKYQSKVAEASKLSSYADSSQYVGVINYKYSDDLKTCDVTIPKRSADGMTMYQNGDAATPVYYYNSKDGKYYAMETVATAPAGATKISDEAGDDGYKVYTADDGKTYYSNNGTNFFKLQDTPYDGSTVSFKTQNKDYTFERVSDIANAADKTKATDAIEALRKNGAIDDKITADDVYYRDGMLVFKSNIDALRSEGGSGTESILRAYHINDPATKKDTDTYTSIDSMTQELNTLKVEADRAKALLDLAEATYEAMSVPAYIGNCKLTPLSTLDSNQVAEINQVIKDMNEQDVNTNITKCFTSLDGTYTADNYSGGLYTFTLNGNTYFTTYHDLLDSLENGEGINQIDNQPRLPYYFASYVSTRIDNTANALLETDGNGRFTSIRLNDDSMRYTLEMETVTDDVAYKDAMNKYYYESAQYDKMIQDINVKTSLIQQEDQQLELRLKQLDTEQNALSTEIDAVSKVVKDNVEKSFKTFGG